MNNTKKFSPVMFDALEVASNITPSVLAVAVEAGIKPKAFADMIANDEEVSKYRAEVAKHLQDAFIKIAVEKEKELKEKKGSE